MRLMIKLLKHNFTRRYFREHGLSQNGNEYVKRYHSCEPAMFNLFYFILIRIKVYLLFCANFNKFVFKITALKSL